MYSLYIMFLFIFHCCQHKCFSPTLHLCMDFIVRATRWQRSANVIFATVKALTPDTPYSCMYNNKTYHMLCAASSSYCLEQSIIEMERLLCELSYSSWLDS